MSKEDKQSKQLKLIPIATILLILNTMSLQQLHSAASLRWWWVRLERIPGGDVLFVRLERLLQHLAVSTIGMVSLCFVFVVINWQNRLWHPWLAIGISALWLIMLLTMLSSALVLH